MGHTRSLQDAQHPNKRAAAIEVVRQTFRYGPPLGGGPSYPEGPLAKVLSALDQKQVQADVTPVLQGTQVDTKQATLNKPEVSSETIQTADD